MDMIRCNQSAGTYKIALLTLNHEEEFRHQIQTHAPIWINAETADARVVDQGPAISNKEGFNGEICVHELEWLETSVPGTTYPINYQFTWEKLKK